MKLDWLDDHEVENSEDVANVMVDAGLSTDDLEKIKNSVSEQNLESIVQWVASVLNTERMVSEIQEASDRISTLVKSIKSYTHMDRGQDVQTFDVHDGIRNTLTMLNHKLRKNNVKVLEEYAKGLPPVSGMPGELNQIWTNVIDNAIDAMHGRDGQQLEIRTTTDGKFVKIYITDNGPGIPEEVRSRIFDPFFTTKGVGEGTGLGLDVVRRIVTQHRGDIKVQSEPGKTEFLLCFPAA